MKLTNKITVCLMAAAACMAMAAAEDLPKELAGVPKTEIKDVSKFIYGPKADDPEYPQGKVVVFTPAKNAKNYGGIGMGVFDKKYYDETKKVLAFSRPKPVDEKYHWYKIQRTGKNVEFQGSPHGATVYLENWKIGARVSKDFKGKFECWVLVRAQGPFYVAGSTKENKVFLSRVLLVPIK